MTNTAVELTRNDSSESFTFKAHNVTHNNGRSVLVKSVISAVGDLAGADPVLDKESYEVTGVIKDMEAGDYPNSGTYSDHAYGQAEELRRVTKEWGPDTSDGLTTLQWDGRSIDVVISKLNLTEDRQQDAPRQYTFTLELMSYDVYVG